MIALVWFMQVLTRYVLAWGCLPGVSTSTKDVVSRIDLKSAQVIGDPQTAMSVSKYVVHRMSHNSDISIA